MGDTANSEDSQQPMDLDNVGDGTSSHFLEILIQHIDSHNIRSWWDAHSETTRDAIESRLFSSLSDRDAFIVKFERCFYFAYIGKEENELETAGNDRYNECVKEGIAPNPVPGIDLRVAPLTLGLDQDYCGKFDLLQFQQRIDATFEWYEKEEEREKYISPSFSIIQSSGMGKTKLMKQYKKVMNYKNPSDIRVVLLLCVHGEDKRQPADYKNHFDHLLHVPMLAPPSEDGKMKPERDKLIQRLNEILIPPEMMDEKNPKTKKIVLLIDEAHILVMESKGGFYVTLRWWLRQKRSDDLKIVAVFAGTLLSLANYQRIAPGLGWTRDPVTQYHNYNASNPSDDKKQLYDPFYTFTTMAMEHVRFEENTWDTYLDELHDIRKCGYFGRPLFAAMLKADKNNNGQRALVLLERDVSCDMENGKGRIINAQLHSIMARVLLSNQVGWRESNDSVASVLATRVQLGIASYEFVAKATSKGYGNLVHFCGEDNSGNRSFGTASIAFPPDPVCAALAMGIMQDSWSLAKPGAGNTDTIVGAAPQFWVQRASAVFEQHLFLPNRGDAGEVFAALYMLLCGDELRKGVDPCLRKFEINLGLWLKSLGVMAGGNKGDQPGDLPKEEDAPKTEVRRSLRVAKQADELKKPSTSDPPADVLDPATSSGLKLNFIQVVRNYFRAHAWFLQNHLKFMYDAAVACYVFNNCPAIDLVFAIWDASTKKYHPALVSIKCWDMIGHADMEVAMYSMKTYLKNYRTDSAMKALCILIVIGSQNVGKIPQGEGTFPKDDAFVTVVVPKEDKFGVTDVIIKCAASAVRAEVLASHPFAHVEGNEGDRALRASTRGKDLEFGKAVLVDQRAVEMEAECEME